MAVTVSWFNKFLEHVGKGDIDLDSHTFKAILVNGYTFDATDDVIADIGAVELSSGAGYTAGGQSLTGLTFAYATGYTKWDANDASWDATSGSIGPCTGAVIYDDTATGDMLVCYIDFGGSETATDGTAFKITFNVNGIFRIAYS